MQYLSLGLIIREKLLILVAIVHPDVAFVNNIAPAHIEGFGGIDGVARTKGEIHEDLSAEYGCCE